MDHKNIRESISLFMDNELPKEQQRELFIHLAECEECREFFVESKRITDAVKSFESTQVPAVLDAKFSVLEMVDSPKPFRTRTVTISVPSALATAGAVIMMTLFIYIVGNIQEQNLSNRYRQSYTIVQQRTVNTAIN